jgi:hypothetical protein
MEPTQLDQVDRDGHCLLTETDGDRHYLYLLGPIKKVPPEDRDRIQSPKHRDLNKERRIMFRIVTVISIEVLKK